MNDPETDTSSADDPILFLDPVRDDGTCFVPASRREAGAVPPAPPPAEAVGGDTAEGVHALNNALTVVLGNLEQLRRQALDERGRRQLERAEQGAREAVRLIRQIRGGAGGGMWSCGKIDGGASAPVSR
jgi:hypothetical protein